MEASRKLSESLKRAEEISRDPRLNGLKQFFKSDNSRRSDSLKFGEERHLFSGNATIGEVSIVSEHATQSQPANFETQDYKMTYPLRHPSHDRRVASDGGEERPFSLGKRNSCDNKENMTSFSG
jgi:hypothetical protein